MSMQPGRRLIDLAKTKLTATLAQLNAAVSDADVASLTGTEALTHKDLTDGTNTFPTLNQNTTGSAAKLTTARKINSVSFDGSADILTQPAGQWGPSHLKDSSGNPLIAWAFDPVGLLSEFILTSGRVTLIGLQVPATTINRIIIDISTAGATLTSGQNFVALYQGGTLLSASADQTTTFGSTGYKTIALSAAQTVTAGLVQVAVLSVGTTPPKLRTGVAGFANSPVNQGLSSPGYRYSTADTGATAMPSTLAVQSAQTQPFWAAVS